MPASARPGRRRASLLSLGALPAALPARIELMEEDHLLISSRENAVLLAARRGDVISVQIDGLDPNDHTWSVTVTGIAAGASPDGTESKRFKRTTDGGATLVTLPLSIVIGQRDTEFRKFLRVCDDSFSGVS